MNESLATGIVELISSKKLSRDLIKAGADLGRDECRYLVDLYYQLQDFRIATNNQIRAIVKSDTNEPHEVISFFAEQFEKLEKDIKKVLKAYVEKQAIGQWLLSVTGIGEVISAGLIANLDIRKAKTAGAFWRFCGLDPTVEWLGTARAEKLVDEVCGDKKRFDFEDLAKLSVATTWNYDSILAHFDQTKDDPVKITRTNIVNYFARIPYNKRMHTLAYKIGESFVKVQNNPKDVYGKLFAQRKAYENAKNEALEYKAQAEDKVSKVGKHTEAYKWYSQDMLPPGHIHARARRWVVKLFLSHLFDKWYRLEFNEEPPKPFAISQLGHAHMIEIPE